MATDVPGSPGFTFCMHADDAPHLAVLEGILQGAGIAYYVQNDAAIALWGHSKSAELVMPRVHFPALWVDTARLDEARLLLTPEPPPEGDAGAGDD